MRSLLKHILSVLLFVLKVTDINILDKTEFQTHEVVKFFKKTILILRSKQRNQQVQELRKNQRDT